MKRQILKNIDRSYVNRDPQIIKDEDIVFVQEETSFSAEIEQEEDKSESKRKKKSL